MESATLHILCFVLLFYISPLVARHIIIRYDTAYGKNGIAKQKNRIDGRALRACRRPRYAAAPPRHDSARPERVDYDHAHPRFARRYAVGRRIGSRFWDRRRYGVRCVQFNPCGDNADRRARSAFYQSRRFGFAACASCRSRLAFMAAFVAHSAFAENGFRRACRVYFNARAYVFCRRCAVYLCRRQDDERDGRQRFYRRAAVVAAERSARSCCGGDRMCGGDRIGDGRCREKIEIVAGR